jgi:hypothetical protein
MAPTTRCKFVCEEITLGRNYPTGSPPKATKIKFSAVYPAQDGSDGFKHDEDHAFFNATPYGFLEIHVQNAHAAEMFQPGDEVYLDISLVPKADAVEA